MPHHRPLRDRSLCPFTWIQSVRRTFPVASRIAHAGVACVLEHDEISSIALLSADDAWAGDCQYPVARTGIRPNRPDRERVRASAVLLLRAAHSADPRSCAHRV